MGVLIYHKKPGYSSTSFRIRTSMKTTSKLSEPKNATASLEETAGHLVGG